MTTTNDFDRDAAAWLADGPTELNDRVLVAVLREVHMTRQRRRWAPSWRTAPMHVRWILTSGAVALALAGLFGVLYVGGLRPTPNPSVPPATGPSVPSFTAAPADSAVVDPSTWDAFASPAFGYSARLPADWVERFGTIPNTVDAFLDAGQSDVMHDRSIEQHLLAWSLELPTGVTMDAWADTYVEQVDAAGSCLAPRPEWEAITVDGNGGWLYHGCGDWWEAMASSGHRVYMFSAFGSPPAHAEPFLRAFLTTVRLRPADALLGGAGSTTFTSPLYGYSLELPSAWVATPATDTWMAGTRVGQGQSNVDAFEPRVTVDERAYVAAQPVASGLTLAAWANGLPGTREELGGHCSYDSNGWDPATFGGLTALERPMRCDRGFGGLDWDQYALVSGGVGYLIAGESSMLQLLGPSFAIRP